LCRRVKLCEMSQQQGLPRPERMSSILVAEFSRENCPFSNREHTWKQFHTFRNAVMDILASYGTVGPMGKMPILDTYEESADEWQSSAKNPDFFVVDDDMYGMSVRVEASWNLAKPSLLEELAMFLKQRQEWCVYLALKKEACSYSMTGSFMKERFSPAAARSKIFIKGAHWKRISTRRYSAHIGIRHVLRSRWLG
jgi:hypothetical protein